MRVLLLSRINIYDFSQNSTLLRKAVVKGDKIFLIQVNKIKTCMY